jgi:hypothetical protein
MPVSDMHDEALASRLEEASKVARQISLASNLDEAIQAIADSARNLAGADSCIIYLLRSNGGSEKFEMAASSPEEHYPTEPRFPGGLTEKIITEKSGIVIADAQRPGQGVRVRQEALKAGTLSIAGVPITGMDDRAVGAIYVNSKKRNQFTNADLRVLQALVNLVPLAQGLSRPLVKLIEEAERAAEQLFEIETTARQLCEVIQKKFGFDFLALQAVDQAERSISTIYGTDVAGELIGLAKHPLDRLPSECDIQADIATADPPRIETITDWDDRFDKWIFERYGHRNMSRVWTPIMVLKDNNEEAITGWFNPSAWETVSNGNGRRYTINFKRSDVESRYGECSIDIIGTIEAGYIEH